MKNNPFFFSNFPLKTQYNYEDDIMRTIMEIKRQKKSRNTSFNNKQSKFHVQKQLNSIINMSQNFKNFGGSFLNPDYTFKSSSKNILKDLKNRGVDKAIRIHFYCKECYKPDLINNKSPTSTNKYSCLIRNLTLSNCNSRTNSCSRKELNETESFENNIGNRTFKLRSRQSRDKSLSFDWRKDKEDVEKVKRDQEIQKIIKKCNSNILENIVRRTLPNKSRKNYFCKKSKSKCNLFLEIENKAHVPGIMLSSQTTKKTIRKFFG